MSKRERVEATLNFQETDRVPVYDIILNDAVIQHFTGRFPPLGAEGAKLQCQAISRMLDMTRMAGIEPGEGGRRKDEDGFVWLNYRWTSGGIAERPFTDEKGAKEWLKKAIKRLRDRLDNMDTKRIAEDFRKGFARLRALIGGDTVIIHRESGTGLDSVRFSLGFEFFSYIYADEPELISEYLELSTEHEVRVIHAIADRELSPCALPYGDIACKGGLLHSPEWLRKEFIPRIKRINDAWHEHGVKCLFHSDGDVMEILPDLIDAGIDGLNPIETTAGMSIKDIRAKHGNRLFLAGGIDISNLMSCGTPDEVRAECRKAISEAGRGYFIGSTTELDNGSRLDNILAMLEVAWGVELL